MERTNMKIYYQTEGIVLMFSIFIAEHCKEFAGEKKDRNLQTQKSNTVLE